MDTLHTVLEVSARVVVAPLLPRQRVHCGGVPYPLVGRLPGLVPRPDARLADRDAVLMSNCI